MFRWLHGPAVHAAWTGLALVGAALMTVVVAGCGAASTGATPTPRVPPTSTVSPTPSAAVSPSVPTLRYMIATRGQTLQDLASVALPISSGTNYHWIQTSCTGLTCMSGGMADSGGPAGHTIYQVFACQLAAGRGSGHCGFALAAVGSSTPVQIALVEVDRLTGTQASDPALKLAITTTAQFNGAASIALAVNAGTNYHWTPANDAQGITCTSRGLADPGGPPGHVQYQVFTYQLSAGQATGQGHMTFAEVGSNTPMETAQITLQLGR